MKYLSTVLGFGLAWMAATVTWAQQGLPLERFFTSATTRAELNRARAQYAQERPDIAGPAEVQETFELEDVTVNGLIMRSDGTGQVWVNRSSDTARSGPVDSIRLDASNRKDPAVTVTLPGGNQIKLRPGEVFSLETGTVREGYQVVDRPATEPEPKSEEPAPEESVADGEDKQADSTRPPAEFDESRLAEGDVRIKLLEERMKKLESGLDETEVNTPSKTGSQRP